MLPASCHYPLTKSRTVCVAQSCEPSLSGCFFLNHEKIYNPSALPGITLRNVRSTARAMNNKEHTMKLCIGFSPHSPELSKSFHNLAGYLLFPGQVLSRLPESSVKGRCLCGRAGQLEKLSACILRNATWITSLS